MTSDFFFFRSMYHEKMIARDHEVYQTRNQSHERACLDLKTVVQSDNHASAMLPARCGYWFTSLEVYLRTTFFC